MVPELVEGKEMHAIRAASSLREMGGAKRGLRLLPFDKLRDQIRSLAFILFERRRDHFRFSLYCLSTYSGTVLDFLLHAS